MKVKTLLIVCWLASLHQLTLGQQPKLIVQSGHVSEVTRIWLSPNEKNLVSLSEDELVFWEVSSQTILREVKNVREFYVTPNRKAIATLDKYYQRLILWDFATGTPLFSVDNFYDWNFSPDGNNVISCHENGVLRIWPIFGTQILQTQLPTNKPIVNCMLSAEGLFLFGTDENNGTLYTGKVIDGNNKTFVGGLIKQVFFQQLKDIASWGTTPTGKLLIIESRNKDLAVLEPSTGVIIQISKEIFSKQEHHWELSPAGKYMIIYGNDHWESILETATGQIKYSFREGSSNNIQISSDDDILYDGLSFYSLAENRSLPPIQAIETVPAIADKRHYYRVGPNGKILLLYEESRFGGRHPLALWDVKEGQQLFASKQRQSSLEGYALDLWGSDSPWAFSGDGNVIAFREKRFRNGSDSQIRLTLWDILTGKETRLFESIMSSRLVQFPAGGVPGGIVSSSNYVPIRLQTSSKYALSAQMAFNSRGNLLFVGDATGNITIWDVVNLRRLSSLKAHSHALQGFFKKNGDGLSVFDTRTTYRLWDFKGGNISNRLQSHLPDDAADSITGAFNDDACTIREKTSGSVILKRKSEDGSEVSPKNNLCLAIKGGSNNSQVNVWNVKTQKVVFTKRYLDYRGGTLSPTAKYLLTCRIGSNGPIDIWDIENNKLKLSLPREGEDIDTNSLKSPGFIDDGKCFAVGHSHDDFISRQHQIKRYSLGIWNIENGERIFVADNITYHRFNNDRTSLMVELADRIKMWDFKRNISRETKFPSNYFISQKLAWYQSCPSSGNKHWVFWPRKSGEASNDAILWNSIKGKLFMLSDHSSLITSAEFSPDERFLLTSSEDGTMKIWGTDNGQLVLTLVLLDDSDWLATTPEGFFDGTANAWKHLQWRLDENTQRAVELYFNEFFYPNLLQDVFAGKAPKPKAGQELDRTDRRQPRIEIVAINREANPRLDAKDARQASTEKRTVTVAIEVTDNIEKKSQPNHGESSGAQDLRLFRNGSLVKVWHDDVFKLGKADGCEPVGPTRGDEPRRMRCQVEIPIIAGENQFTTYAFNTDNVKSNDASAIIQGADTLRRDGTLYILAIGVNQYANPKYNLQFAVPDVVDISTAIQREQGKLVRNVKLKQYVRTEIITLTDENATKENILLALRRFAKGKATGLPGTAPDSLKTELRKIKPTRPEDGLIIYFAGHGTARGERFYLLPHNFTGASEWSLVEQSVSDIELNQVLEEVDAGRLLMVIDACQSGQALGASNEGRAPMNSKGLAQLAYDKGMSILTAAQSQQAALEAVRINNKIIRHGLLTYALLRGLVTAEADKDGNQQVWEREWLDFASEQVPLMQLAAMKQCHLESKQIGRDTELFYWAGDDKSTAPESRTVQRPRVFYRREPEAQPLVMAKPKSK